MGFSTKTALNSAQYPSSPDQVCAVIPTYRPDPGFPERVEGVRGQVGAVVIVDDGDCAANVSCLRQWFAGRPGVTLYHNPANLGIAASLNRGIALAGKAGFTWVLLLDDDSRVRPDMVARLTGYLQDIGGPKPIAAIGMSYDLRGEGGGFPLPGERGPWSEKRGIISSGTLLSLETYSRVGPFRDDFFIDSVDYEFCLRARRKGYRIIKTEEVGFVHSLGRLSSRVRAGIRLTTCNYNKNRLYYQFRNLTILAVEYGKREPLYLGAVFWTQIKTLFKILGLEADKGQKFRYCFRGLGDGLKKRTGKRFTVED